MIITKIKTQIAIKLGITKSEEIVFFYSLLLAFLIGLIQSLLYVSSISLFITRFGSYNIPKFYLILSCILIVFNYAYAFFAEKHSFNMMTYGFIICIAAFTILLGVFILSTDVDWLYGFLAGWGGVIQALFGFKLWDFLNQIYNLQQAKRLFGILAASQSIGWIVAGFSLPFFLIFLNNQEIILAIAPSFLLLLILFRKLFSHGGVYYSNAAAPVTAPKTKKQLNLFGYNYLIKLVFLVAFMVFSVRIVDLLFNTVAAEHYPTEEKLASFLGVYVGIAAVLCLFVDLFVFKWMLRHLGLVATLTLLPFFVFSFCLLLSLTYILPFFALFFFPIIFLLQLAEKVASESVFKSSYLLFLHPFPFAIRSSLLSKNEMVIIPVSTIAVCLLLMLFINYYTITSVLLIAFLMLISALSLFIIYKVRYDYFSKLFFAIKNFSDQSYTLDKPNKDHLPFLQNNLTSSYPEEIIHSLICIEKIDKVIFFKSLEKVLILPNLPVEVKFFVLNKINEHKVKCLVDLIFSQFFLETDLRVKSLIIMTVSALNFPLVEKSLPSLFALKAGKIRRALLLSILKHGDLSIKKTILEKINVMFKSKHEMIRGFSAFLLEESYCENEVDYFLPTLLMDQSFLVKRQALFVIIKYRKHLYFNELLSLFYLLDLDQALLGKLLNFSGKLMPFIEKNFRHYPLNSQMKILYFLGKMKTNSATNFLQERIFADKHSPLSIAALQAFISSRCYSSSHFSAKLFANISDYSDELKKYQTYLAAIPVHRLSLLLRGILKEKALHILECLMLTLSIYYPFGPIREIKTALDSGQVDKASYALELLERTLIKEHRKKLSPILADFYLTEPEEKDDLTTPACQSVIRHCLKLEDQEILSILACMACLYIIKTTGKGAFEPELKELRYSDSILIQETLDWLYT